MERLSFPDDARAVLLDALEKIAADSTAQAWLRHLVGQYDQNEHCDYNRLLADSKALGAALEIHEYTMAMLLFLCFAERLRERYAERGLDETVYWDSMADLRYKLEECRLVHGVVGSFVAPWFGGFFNLTRFALGRLQFEIIHTQKDFTVGGELLPAGSPVINIHIPRTGTRLAHDLVQDAYRRAAVWFAGEFGDGPITFTCSSWLLDPWHLTVLPPTSNMVAFINDFEIVETKQYDSYREVWRLFDCEYTGDPDALPQDSSLRRAYVERIKRGEPTGSGRGFFRLRGENK